MKLLLIYLIFINIVAVIITVHDKLAAKHGTWRVKESSLLFVSVLGGAPLMYATMLIIRHKTLKPKFMIGIPIIFVVELGIAFALMRYVFRII